MSKQKKKPKLEQGSLWLLVILGIAPLIIAGLQKLSVIDLSMQTASILVLIGSAFVMNEQRMKHGKKLFKQTSTIILSIFIGIASISAITSLIGFQIATFEPIEGFLLLGVAIGTIVEVFN